MLQRASHPASTTSLTQQPCCPSGCACSRINALNCKQKAPKNYPWKCQAEPLRASHPAAWGLNLHALPFEWGWTALNSISIPAAANQSWKQIPNCKYMHSISRIVGVIIASFILTLELWALLWPACGEEKGKQSSSFQSKAEHIQEKVSKHHCAK